QWERPGSLRKTTNDYLASDLQAAKLTIPHRVIQDNLPILRKVFTGRSGICHIISFQPIIEN
ncbi:MAG: hypothetical protein JSV68_06035, partial [Anaerolineaceae bacterium]